MLIIFDLDGVLIDSEPLAAEAMSTVLGSFGHDVSPKDIMHSYTAQSLKDILAKVGRRRRSDLAGHAETRRNPVGADAGRGSFPAGPVLETLRRVFLPARTHPVQLGGDWAVAAFRGAVFQLLAGRPRQTCT